MDSGQSGANMVLIVGCPRSGTTWLQRLLAEHEQVTTGQESHVFNYLADLLRRWRSDLENGGQRPAGMGCYLTEEEFMTALRRFAADLQRPLTGGLEEGELFLEKTPSHARCLAEIGQLLPEVRVIHVVRDPRDVVASMLAASRTWASGWAPETARAAARKWRSYHRAVKRARSLFEPGRFLETSYEAMLRDSAAELQRALDFLDLPYDDAFIERATDVNRAGSGTGGTPIPLRGELARRLDATTVKEPAGFIRRANSGGWHRDLTPLQKITVWRLLRREMAECGYHWPLAGKKRGDAPSNDRVVRVPPAAGTR